MNFKIFVFMLGFLAMSTLGAAEPNCEKKPSFADTLASKVATNNKCSKSMKEAINYKESGKEAQKSAMLVFNSLCPLENEFTSPCIVMGKDAAIKNPTLASVCKTANKLAPLCLLTAVSKKKSEKEMISFCSNASEKTIKSM
jgi:hypothetical protein